MKTIRFAHSKRPFLTFDAEEMSTVKDGSEFVIQAGGRITFQDTPALEEHMHSPYPCLLTVQEAEEELLHGQYHVTFLCVEETELAIRIAVDN